MLTLFFIKKTQNDIFSALAQNMHVQGVNI